MPDDVSKLVLRHNESHVTTHGEERRARLPSRVSFDWKISHQSETTSVNQLSTHSLQLRTERLEQKIFWRKLDDFIASRSCQRQRRVDLANVVIGEFDRPLARSRLHVWTVPRAGKRFERRWLGDRTQRCTPSYIASLRALNDR